MKRITNSLIAFLLIAMMIGCSGTEKKQSTGEYIDDSAITSKIKSALAADPTVSAMDVKVKTFKRRVQLSGFVDTKEQAQTAEDIAEGIEGVESVENNIIVK